MLAYVKPHDILNYSMCKAQEVWLPDEFCCIPNACNVVLYKTLHKMQQFSSKVCGAQNRHEIGLIVYP